MSVLKSREIQSGHSELSVIILQVSAAEGCLLSGFPLYTLANNKYVLELGNNGGYKCDKQNIHGSYKLE